MLLYSLLHLTGYDLPLERAQAVPAVGQHDARPPGAGHTPGVETTTGPLGQGFGNAVGMAMAERFLAARFNRPGHQIVDHTPTRSSATADLMEGVASEAASLAGHLGLGKLICLYDDNRISLAATVNLTFTEDVAQALRGLWLARAARCRRQRPRRRGRRHRRSAGGGGQAVAARRANEHRLRLAPSRTPTRFTARRSAPTRWLRPSSTSAILRSSRSTCPTRRWPISARRSSAGKQWEAEWQGRFEAYAQAYPDLAAEWQRVHGGRPAGRIGMRMSRPSHPATSRSRRAPPAARC